jgi:zinc protease
MERCRAQAEAQFVYRLQTVGGFGGKGDQLNAYNVFLGQPDYFDRDLARYRGASAVALQQAASAYLRPESRVILSVVPQGRTAVALADAAPAVVA